MATPAFVNELPDVVDEQQVLKFTQSIRMTAIAEMCRNGMPVDSESVTSIVKLADGMDRAALGSLRAKADLQQGKNQAAMVDLIAEALKSDILNGVYTPAGVVGKPRDLGEIQEVFEAQPGEFEVGVKSQTYNEFMERMLPESVDGS